VNRRALITLVGGAAAWPRAAWAQSGGRALPRIGDGMTAFTAFAFAAAGGPVNGRSPVARTMPVRFNDIINVKDWGAKGDGVTNDSAAINAAIEYAMFLNPFGHGGSVVYVPPGTYFVGANPITLGKDWQGSGGGNKGLFILEGAGRDATKIVGNYGGGGTAVHPAIAHMDFISGNYQALMGIRNITFQNDSTAGGSMACTIENVNQIVIQNCKFIGNCGLVYGDTFGTSVINCVAICNQPTIPPDTVTAGGLPPKHASMGFCGYQTAFWGCYAEGFQYGFCPAGPGSSVIGCHAYRCTEGIDLGFYSVGHDDAGNINVPGYGSGFESSVACTVMGNRFERCKYGIFTRVCTAPLIAGNIVEGPAGVTDTAFVASKQLPKATVVANNFEVPCSGSSVYLPEGGWQSTFASIVGAYGWWVPQNNRATIAYINCGQSGAPPLPNTLAAPVAFLTYADVYAHGGEGEEFTIIDATSATFGQAVTGGSNHRYKVRWNGTDWIRTG